MKPYWEQIGLGRANNNGVSSLYGNPPWPPRPTKSRGKRKGVKSKSARKRKAKGYKPASPIPPAWVLRLGDPPPFASNMGRGHLDPERDMSGDRT